MDTKTKTLDPAQPRRRAAMRFIPDGADYIGVSRTTAWRLAQADADFLATVTLFKIGILTMALTDELDRFLALKKAKCAGLQVERMKRMRAHRAKHDGEFDKTKAMVSASSAATAQKFDGEFDAETAEKKMPA
ncbi:hypothetical protein PQQ73_06275 [Paraburkholderia strydomiana]|uniref:DNA-binding protein n=1 Tax=Paraburkholderia strydomiana TaxID=1245417 RepID=A0ABW9EA39_9BURK